MATTLPPPALIAPAPPPANSLIEVDSDGKINLNWNLIHEIAKSTPVEDNTVRTMARALMIAHGEDPDSKSAICINCSVGLTPFNAIPSQGNITLD